MTTNSSSHFEVNNLLFFIFITIGIPWLIAGCQNLHKVAVVVPQVSHDTVYLTNHHYDSIYIDRTHSINRSRDTILLSEKTVEYRYRLLRDTIRITRIDSIPVIREVEVVREVPRPKTWFDCLCRCAFFLLCGVLLFFVYRCIRKFI